MKIKKDQLYKFTTSDTTEVFTLTCVASVSVQFRSKKRPRNGIFGFDSARNETRALTLFPIFPAVFDSCSPSFAPKPHKNACYAGYIHLKHTNKKEQRKQTEIYYIRLLTNNICSFSVVLLMNCRLSLYMLFQLFFQTTITQPHARNI